MAYKASDDIIDPQLGLLPKEIKYCKKCVISNQRPRIQFDEEGICNACRNAQRKRQLINWEEREQELIELLNQYRSKDGRYDVLVPGSGGKDSSIVAHKLKYIYGMHPLTVTWAPFVYTDIGWQNYIAFKDSGFDNILGFPDGKLHRKLSFLSFDLLGDNFQPFVYGQMAYCYHMAVKFKIPLIFYGENGEEEYGGSVKNQGRSGEELEDFAEYYYKSTGVDLLVSEGLKRGIFEKEEIHSESFELYKNPDLDEIRNLKVKMKWWSYYQKWDPQEHYYYAAEHTGFRANPMRSEGTYSKYASLDDRMDGFHFYMAFIKFGIGRATSDAAHEIRDGHLTRDEAVALVRKYDGEFPDKYFKEFLDYINIDEKNFWHIVDKFRKDHIWTKESGTWKLRRQVEPIPDIPKTVVTV